MKTEFTSITEAFEAGKKIGFVIGFQKATQIVINNCKKMQGRVLPKSKEGGAE